MAEGQASPHEDILINVEAFRGAIRKGNWKLVKIALLPGKTELFDLSKDPGEQHNVADQFPEVVSDLSARLDAYAKEMKPSLWIKAQPAFLGAQGKTIFDPDFDIDDSGLPHEKAAACEVIEARTPNFRGLCRDHIRNGNDSMQALGAIYSLLVVVACCGSPAFAQTPNPIIP